MFPLARVEPVWVPTGRGRTDIRRSSVHATVSQHAWPQQRHSSCPLHPACWPWTSAHSPPSGASSSAGGSTHSTMTFPEQDTYARRVPSTLSTNWPSSFILHCDSMNRSRGSGQVDRYESAPNQPPVHVPPS